MRLADHLDRWLARCALALRPSTLRERRLYVRAYLSPALGHLELDALTVEDCDALWASLVTTLSPRTVSHIRAALTCALNDAVRRGLVGANPALSSVRPRCVPYVSRPWTADETRRFLDATRDDPMHHVWVMLAMTGMRAGEACALTWQDFDPQRRILYVDRSMDFAGTLQPPKTRSGRRQVPVPSMAVSVLLRASGRASAPIVGLTPIALSKRFTRLVKSLDLRPIRLHDLRHGVATTLLAQGTDAETVRGLLGHSHVSTTLSFYVHPAPQAAVSAMEGLGQALM